MILSLDILIIADLILKIPGGGGYFPQIGNS